MATELPVRAASPAPAPVPARAGWTAGRVVALAAGLLLALISFGLLAGGAALTWADLGQHGGYVTIGTASYSTSGYAVVSDPVDLHGGWDWFGRFVGGVRIQVTPADPAQPVSVAIGPSGDVSRYLAGTSYATVSAFGDEGVTEHAGTAVPAVPASAGTWVARTGGTGTQTLRWTAQDGEWTAVVMNSGGSKGVAARVVLSVSSPMLPWLAGELLAAGVFAGLPAVLLIVVPVRRATRRG